MAKANQWFRGVDKNVVHNTHSKEGMYKIPIKDRKAYWLSKSKDDYRFGTAKLKWVSKQEYNNYLKWKQKQT